MTVVAMDFETTMELVTDPQILMVAKMDRATLTVAKMGY